MMEIHCIGYLGGYAEVCVSLYVGYGEWYMRISKILWCGLTEENNLEWYDKCYGQYSGGYIWKIQMYFINVFRIRCDNAVRDWYGDGYGDDADIAIGRMEKVMMMDDDNDNDNDNDMKRKNFLFFLCLFCFVLLFKIYNLRLNLIK